MSSEQPLEPLLEDALSGSQTAFGELYRLLAPPVLGYLRLQGAAEPDDLCSEVFIGVFRNLAGFSGSMGDFRSWVFSVAHRRIIDERRRLGRRPGAVSLDDITAHPRQQVDVETEVGDRLGTARVVEICAGLAPDQRDVLLLRLVCDLTIDQIADALGKSSGAVKALQRRALGSVVRTISNEGVPL